MNVDPQLLCRSKNAQKICLIKQCFAKTKINQTNLQQKQKNGNAMKHDPLLVSNASP
jgi:hypothetical protein